MKVVKFTRLAFAGLTCLYLQSCALDEYFESHIEQYTKSFIKEFGLVDPEQDWTMGHTVNAEINVGGKASSVKIYGKYGNTYYKVADLSDIGGRLTVPVHVPKTCTEMLVKVDGRCYYGNFGAGLNCTGVSGRGIPESIYDASGNPNPAVFEKTVAGYGVEVRHTESGNDPENKAYQRFNTQQMGPLVSTGIWSDYYSLNSGETRHNTNNDRGLLPESGVYNADRTFLDNVLKNSVSDVAVDFSIDAGENGAFTLFPYYYGTNLVHELGVYLLEDDGKTPRYNGGELIKLPIFVDEHPGDMQVQPHYCSEIASIKAFDANGNELEYVNPLEMMVGDTHQLDVRLYDSSGKEIAYDEAFKKKYHSRIAYHCWVESALNAEGKPENYAQFGVKFVESDDNGLLTANVSTYDVGYDDGRKWIQVAIATGLDGMDTKGVEFNFPVRIKAGGYDKTVVPEGVAKTAGNVGQGYKSTIIGTGNDESENFASFAGITDKWGASGCGNSSDNYYRCLFQRDESGNLKKDDKGNLLLAADKVQLLYDDIRQSMKDNVYTVKGAYSSFEFSTADYELVGLEILEKYTNEYWLQFDIYVDKPGQYSAPRRSRAEIPAAYADMLTSNGQWKDVNRCWSRYLPAGKEVASYPVDQPMLARTRGYDVKLKNADGTPYTGKFGMYVTIKKENGENMDTKDYANPYTLYSQQERNEFGQRSAAAFNHPVSGRTFFTFEDMNLTHLAADEGGRDYDPWEKSSDRDVNDLIFLINGYEKIEGDKEITEKEDINEEGFHWIWALEDLGSTGDFDFNDLVMRVSDIAINKTTTKVDGETTTTVSELISREIRFKPLAAGGTLPLHIHLNYKGTDYTLAPGKYDLTKGEAPTGMELHKWFGEGVPYTRMINTGVSPHLGDGGECVLVVDKATTVQELLAEGDGSRQSMLYVVVQGTGDETWKEMQAIDNERLESKDDAYLVPLPEKGKAAQSFFILDATGKGNWQWPTEYTHICKAYPKFREWVGDTKVEWLKDVDTDYVYKGK